MGIDSIASSTSRWLGVLARNTFVRYLITGGSLFLIDLAVFLFLAKVAGLPIALAQLLSRATGAAVGFFGHRYFTFRASLDAAPRDARKQGVAYIAVTVANFFISPLVLLAILSLVGQELVLGKFLAEIVLVLMTYAAMSIVFRKKEQAE